MESQTLAESSTSTKDLIKQSFIVAAGSLSAHALFIKGLALHLNIGYSDVVSEFQRTILRFDQDDIVDILGNMTKEHGGNKQAKDGAIRVFKEQKTLETVDILIKQIPKEQLLNENLLFLRKTYPVEIVSKALTKIWENNNQEAVNVNLKSLAACLELYNQLEWYRTLPQTKKDELINRGKEILEEVRLDIS